MVRKHGKISINLKKNLVIKTNLSASIQHFGSDLYLIENRAYGLEWLFSLSALNQ